MLRYKTAMLSFAMLAAFAGGGASAQDREHSRMRPMAGDGPHGGPEGDGVRRGPPPPERMFAMLDANRDGVVSRAEFMAFHASRHGPGPGGPRGEGPPPPRPGR